MTTKAKDDIHELEKLDTSHKNIDNEDATQSSDADSEHKVAAPDGGWGWMVVLGCLMAHFLLAGMARSFGVIYVILQDRFSSTAAVTAWIGSLYNAIRFGGGPVSAALVNRFQFRPVVTTGGVLICAGFVASAFVPNILTLFFTYSFVIGFGASLVFAPGYIIVGQYFDKKKGKAMGFATVGSGIGGLAVPWILKLLYDTYAYQGAMIILGAIMLNCCVIGALYRSLKSPQRKPKTTVVKMEENKSDNYTDPEAAEKCLNSSETVDPNTDSEKRVPESIQNSSGKSSQKNNKKKVFDIALLANRTFFMYGILCLCLSITQQVFNIFIVALAKERGVDDTRAIILVAACGFSDMIGRFLSGFWFDLKFMRKYRRYLLCAFLFTGSSCEVLLPFTTNFIGLVILSSLLGFLMGTGHAQRATVLSDFIEAPRMSNAIGFLIWFQGVGQLFGPALAGFLRDYFGQYGPTFFFGGGSQVLSVALFIIESFIPKSCCRPVKKKNVQTDAEKC